MGLATPLILRPGTEVDGYVLEAVLGAGGSGAVYRASRGGRVHALKLLWLEHVGRRAEREAVLLLHLKHRNVVGFRGCGYWPDAAPRFFYLVMEYVEGQRLDEWAEAERPGARAVAREVLHVARALAAVHAARAVHRDVKEANVLVRRDDGEAVLVDFGAGGYEGAPGLTVLGLPPGTADYRAPEAWRFVRDHMGNPHTRYVPGPRDDLYALGVVLYRLLAGRSPRVELASGEDAMEAFLHRLPTSPRVLNPRVPPELSDVCLGLLAPRPEDRTPDAESVCVALESLLARADTRWDVPLHDANAPLDAPARVSSESPHRERLTRHEEPARTSSEAQGERTAPNDARGPLEESARPSTEATGRGKAPREAPPRWGRRAAVIALVAALGPGALLVTRGMRPRAGVANERPSPLAAMAHEPDREVAARQAAPEAVRAAAPHTGGPTPAAVATPAARSKDEASVKQQQPPQDVGTLPALDRSRTASTRSLLAATCLGLGAACASAPKARPPPPEECPPGAREKMNSFGIEPGFQHGGALPEQGDERVVLVREGATTLRVLGPWFNLPENTTLFGRILFGEGRVYGRFTEARTPEGDRFPVCIEMHDTSGGRGVLREPGEGPGTARAFSTVTIYAVERFE
jgi:serine/threonine protein kinase